MKERATDSERGPVPRQANAEVKGGKMGERGGGRGGTRTQKETLYKDRVEKTQGKDRRVMEELEDEVRGEEQVTKTKGQPSP